MKYVYFIAFFFLHFEGFCQNQPQKPFRKIINFFQKNQIDTAYIEKYPQKWWVRTQVGHQLLALELQDENENRIIFQPFQKQYISVGFGGQNLFKIFRKSISLGIGHREYFSLFPQKNFPLQSSQVYDNRLNFSVGRLFHADVILLSYKGFYTQNQEKNHTFPQMKVRMLAGRFSYVKNFSQFSMEAAFNQTEIQKQMAFTSFFGVNYCFFDAENLPSEFYKNTSNFQNQAGIHGGLAFVDKLHWKYPNLQLALYVNVTINGVFPFDSWRSLAFGTTGKATVFYHFKNASLALEGHKNRQNIYASQMKNNLFSVNPDGYYLSYIYRFNLKKK